MALSVYSQRYVVPCSGCLSLPFKIGISRQSSTFRSLSGHEGSMCLRDSLSRLRCSAEDSSSSLITLPIFPLSVVALPFCTVPLHIFEARYRVLFNTLLAGASGLEDGLVQVDSPFKGTRKFGMCLVNKSGMVRVGTTLEIQSHMRLEDGRLMITSKGQDRFRVVNVVREQPVLVCEVEPYNDEEDMSQEEMKVLSDDVCELYRNVVKLSRKVKGSGRMMEDVPFTEPEEFNELSPSALSFWFASLFTESAFEQQKLLEERSSRLRLEREKKLFDDALKYLTAASALKGVFQSDDTENRP